MQLEVPVVGILRGIDGDFFRALLPVAFGAGLTALEITMNTPGAAEIVARCRPEVPPGKLLGMGTIRNVAEAETAIGAGAMFLVTPNTDPRVIELAKGRGIPVIAGAFTPTEVYVAWAAGADLVKIFPCGVVGPGYLRELRGPFDQIPLVAVGGVNRNNVGDFFAAGATAVGVGNSLFGQAALTEQNLDSLAVNIRQFLAAIPTRPPNR